MLKIKPANINGWIEKKKHFIEVNSFHVNCAEWTITEMYRDITLAGCVTGFHTRGISFPFSFTLRRENLSSAGKISS